MLYVKNIGELSIPSNESPSVNWKIPDLFSNLDYCIDCSFESPPFMFRTETLKITFLSSYSQNWFLIQVVRADDTACMTNFIHKRGIKRKDNTVYDFLDFNARKSARLWGLSTFRNNRNSFNSYVIIFVEFSLSNKSIKDYEGSLLSVPLSSMKSSSPPCKECGHVNHNGQDILTKNLKELYINETHSDFLINVGERKFKTHKAILAAQSKVFAAMMKHDMTEKINNEVDVNDCDPNAFHDFLLYLYSGRVETFSDESVVALYAIADKYDVEDLKAECINYMKSNLSVDMFCSFIELALKHEEAELLKLSKEYFTNNAKKILSSPNWQSFLIQNATLANELFLLMVPST